MKFKKYSKKAAMSNTSEKSETKKTKTGMIIIVLILGLMVFSVIASVFFFKTPQNTDNTNDYTYNGLKFQQADNGWKTNIQGRDVTFDYLPSELQDINIRITQEDTKITGIEKYVIFSPQEYKSNDYEIYIFRISMQQLGQQYYPACLNTNSCEDIPIKKCDNANVLIKKSETNNITKNEEGCIILSAKEGDMIKVINKYKYLALGIN